MDHHLLPRNSDTLPNDENTDPPKQTSGSGHGRQCTDPRNTIDGGNISRTCRAIVRSDTDLVGSARLGASSIVESGVVFAEYTILLKDTLVGDNASFRDTLNAGDGVAVGDNATFHGLVLAAEAFKVGKLATFHEGITTAPQKGSHIGEGSTFDGFATLGNDSNVGDAATFNQGCFIGAGSDLGSGCTIKPSDKHYRSIIGNNCTIGSKFCDTGPATIGENCSIGSNSLIMGAVTIGPECTIGAYTYIGPGVTVKSGTTADYPALVHLEAKLVDFMGFYGINGLMSKTEAEKRMSTLLEINPLQPEGQSVHSQTATSDPRTTDTGQQLS